MTHLLRPSLTFLARLTRPHAAPRPDIRKLSTHTLRDIGLCDGRTAPGLDRRPFVSCDRVIR